MGAAENAVTRSVLGAIALHAANGHPAVFVRVQAGMIKVGDRLIKLAAAGTADLVGVYRGRAVAIEVKTPKGRQADSQREWEAQWTAAGGVYRVVRSGSEALELLQQIDQELGRALHPQR